MLQGGLHNKLTFWLFSDVGHGYWPNFLIERDLHTALDGDRDCPMLGRVISRIPHWMQLQAMVHDCMGSLARLPEWVRA